MSSVITDITVFTQSSSSAEHSLDHFRIGFDSQEKQTLPEKYSTQYNKTNLLIR